MLDGPKLNVKNGWMGVLQFYVLFNSVTVISGRWEVGNESLCAVELRLRLRRFRLERGSNSGTASSVGQRLTNVKKHTKYFFRAATLLFWVHSPPPPPPPPPLFFVFFLLRILLREATLLFTSTLLFQTNQN